MPNKKTRKAKEKTRAKAKEKAAPLVCALAYDRLCTFEYGIAVELFGLPRPEFKRWYRFKTVAAEGDPLKAIGGLTIATDGGLDLLGGADLIVVPGWRGSDAPVPEALIKSLRRAHKKGARIASICSGVFVLAAAGLLDGRRATTHWRYTEQLGEQYPAVRVEPDVLYVDEGSVLTSAGSAAGLDLGLHIIRRDFGVAAANEVARRLVLPPQRDGGQRQFVAAPVPKAQGGRIAPLLDTMRQELDQPWPVSRMAGQAGLSPRTLARRFREATGQTPLAWLTSARVENAALLLETTNASLADVALSCGFGSPETFRREFRLQRGVSPSQFRATFGVRR